jgi:threonine/homoserine/homoserine lactone efflux protein
MMPGPDQVLVTRHALAGGRRGGLLTLVGGALGLTVHAGTAAVGLSALLLTSATAFTALKIVGVAYLVWLGVQTMRAARHTGSATAVDAEPTHAVTWTAYLRQGFLSNALNPKVALFFVTFLPQFLPADTTSPRGQALLLSAVFATLYVAWFGCYALLVDRFGRWLRRPSVRARIERVTGIVLVTFALRLATATH